MADISLGTFGSLFTRLVTYVPAVFLRKKYNKLWLASHIAIDLRARNNPVTINGGELAYVDIWLNITNYGYFLVELDRLKLDFLYAGLSVNAPYLKKTEILPSVTISLYIKIPLTAEQVAHISKNKENAYIAIQVSAEFKSEIHDFSVDTGHLTGVNPRLVNI